MANQKRKFVKSIGKKNGAAPKNRPLRTTATNPLSNTLASQYKHKTSLERRTVRSRHTVHERAVTDAERAHLLEQLHGRLGGQRSPVINEILSLLLRQRGLLSFAASRSGKTPARKELIDKSNMVVDLEVLSTLPLTVVKDIFDGNLTLVVSEEVVEGNRRLKPDEGTSKLVNHGRASGKLLEQRALDKTLVEAEPATTRGVDLVRLKVALMLKVGVILVDEVPNLASNLAIRVGEEVFDGRLNVKDGPAVKLGRVHFPYLILATMLAAVDSRDNVRTSVKNVTVELARVGKLKDPLSNLSSRTVNFVKEEHDGLSASDEEPIGRVPRSRLATRNLSIAGIGQAKKVTLSHL